MGLNGGTVLRTFNARISDDRWSLDEVLDRETLGQLVARERTVNAHILVTGTCRPACVGSSAHSRCSPRPARPVS